MEIKLRSDTKPYYQDKAVTIYHGDCREVLPHLPKMDLVLADPPYGLSFMGKDWDKAVPSAIIWQQCLELLDNGTFAFVMCIPRQDCLARMIVNLQDAGFETGFTSLYWAYASGFPKAQNIGKASQAKLSKGGASPRHLRQERQGNEYKPTGQVDYRKGRAFEQMEDDGREIKLTFPQAKALDGSYTGFQPKPAIEVIIVAMKPLSEKIYVDQALKNGKGITWLDDGRIPGNWQEESHKKPIYQKETPHYSGDYKTPDSIYKITANQKGRFPANLLVSDDVLNDGRVRISKWGKDTREHINPFTPNPDDDKYKPINSKSRFEDDSGSFSRYFSLDAWWDEKIKELPESMQRTFPMMIVPKASKRERNKLLDLPHEKNIHSTVKPLKLMAYLITLGSREGDMILDPFMGSGTTLLACQKMGRKAIGIEIEEKYCEIAANRCRQMVMESLDA